MDKLFEAYALDGESRLLAVHLEAQNEPIENLPERVFQYHYRIYERLHRPVASLVLLTDTREDWRPHKFERETLGCKLTLEFPTAKLSDFDTPELAAHPNPFSFVVRAHRRAQASRRDQQKRYDLRLALTEELTEVMERDETEAARLYGVLKFIDWVMPLREELEDKFYNEYTSRHKKEGVMFVPYAERKGRAEGLVGGQAKSVIQVLTTRFGKLPEALPETILRVTEAATLERLLTAAVTCSSLDEFERALSNS